MPASKSGILSEKEQEQRQQAAVKHGAFSKIMTPEKTARLAELEEELSTRQGMIGIQRRQAAKAIGVVDDLLDHVISERRKGISPDDIPTMNKLASYFNTADRVIWHLYQMAPDEGKILDLSEHVQRAMNEGEK